MSSPLPYNTEISQHRYSVPPVPIPMLPSPPERMQVVPVAAVLRRRCRHRALLLLLPQALLPHHHVLLPHVLGAALLPGQPVLHRVSRAACISELLGPFVVTGTVSPTCLKPCLTTRLFPVSVSTPSTTRAWAPTAESPTPGSTPQPSSPQAPSG